MLDPLKDTPEVPNTSNNTEEPEENQETLLHCPIRGQLNSTMLAKDGLTPTEEARRIDFINYLISRDYPKSNIAVETVVLKWLGEKGRNKLRADVIVYDMASDFAVKLPQQEKLAHALLVAEIKRDSTKKATGISCQLEPAMRQLPGMNVLGAYWDDVNRILFVKKLVKKDDTETLEIIEDTLANLPSYGSTYQYKLITFDRLTIPEDLVSTLYNIAHIMRSHGVNDEHLRYKESVKLLLARYCDEKAAEKSTPKELSLQVYRGTDPGFINRIKEVYLASSKRYSRAQSLFSPVAESELDENTLRDIVKSIQGINFSSASNETMQQVFMSFVPAVFKKSLDQYFTPVTLIDTMVRMTDIGPLDKIADPAMGTADFLTSAMSYRLEKDDTDIIQRVFGCDSDSKAYDLAVINMILNRDGQANLENLDSIENFQLWNNEMGVLLCNPPFGARTLEKRTNVLQNYDLGHVWEYDSNAHRWVQQSSIRNDQQLGILFIERCYKMLSEGGRLAIILPEGYLCTNTYGYVRQWIIEHFQILSLVELPRRIFLKSDVDLRSNILIARKLAQQKLKKMNYPIHTGLVRRVGYKLGKGYRIIPKRDPFTGLETRDNHNRLLLSSDFDRVLKSYIKFVTLQNSSDDSAWTGARIHDISSHPVLDMKPRRLMPQALENIRSIRSGTHLSLGEIADVIEDTTDLLDEIGAEKFRRLVEGQNIRAIEGTVMPQEPSRCWSIARRKSKSVFILRHRDIIIGLVRPERRNIGMLLANGNDIVATPDGVAIVRVKPSFLKDYPQGWLFSVLRSEACRLQFWTESGGTSYGKLSRDQIRSVLLPIPGRSTRIKINKAVENWAVHAETSLDMWSAVGTSADRKPILNSPLFGLETDSEYLDDSEIEE